MADAVARLAADPEERKARGAAARRKLLQRHTTDIAAPEIFHVIRSVAGSPPLVSVVVPNYNYAHHLERRLESIFDQTFQDFEIIVQDDGSTDGSLEVLERFSSRRHLRVVAHPENRGVFEMWRRGLEQASGELVWMAEADDLCEPEFLETLVTLLEDPAVKLAYCQSTVIDDEDRRLGDYTLAFPDLSSRKWLAPYRQTLEEELADGLAVRNFLVNASSIVFRKPALDDLDGFPGDFRLAGDWYLYLRVLAGGEIAYSPARLNRHRRHDGSAMASVAPRTAVAEIGRIHRHVLAEHPPDAATAERMVRYAFDTWRQARPRGMRNSLRKIGDYAEYRRIPEWFEKYRSRDDTRYEILDAIQAHNPTVVWFQLQSPEDYNATFIRAIRERVSRDCLIVLWNGDIRVGAEGRLADWQYSAAACLSAPEGAHPRRSGAERSGDAGHVLHRGLSRPDRGNAGVCDRAVPGILCAAAIPPLHRSATASGFRSEAGGTSRRGRRRAPGGRRSPGAVAAIGPA